MNTELFQQMKRFIMRGDVAGAIAFMEPYPELAEFRRYYVEIFEKENYLRFDVPEELDDILRLYQRYFRDVFYLGIEAEKAEQILLNHLRKVLDFPEGNKESIPEKLETLFESAGYHIQCGITDGFYGPYVWKNTVPKTYSVELPDTTGSYTVYILKDFVMRSWMDYLTQGAFGTGGWARKDGTFCCVESAYDFSGEKFQVSLLKHEAQHVEDRNRWPEIEAMMLEYRAKLVELMFTQSPGLLDQFRLQAYSDRMSASHSAAAVRLAKEFAGMNAMEVPQVQQLARALFDRSTCELNQQYAAEMKAQSNPKEDTAW